jgi:clan AA aspartic protease (TIGR02281 family)
MLYRQQALNAFIIAICFGGGIASVQGANPDDFDQGLKLYEKQDFRAASLAFERSVSRWPANPNILYYCALSSQKCGKVRRANELFQHVVANFPETTAAQLSRAYLDGQAKSQSARKPDNYMGSGKGKNVATAGMFQPDVGASAKSSNYDSLPAQDKISFERSGQHLLVEAEINHRPLQMCFDTGAPMTCLTLATLESLNIARPMGPPTGLVQGVGEDAFPSWQVPVDIKVGNITRLHFPIVVVDNPYPLKGIEDLPLLGQSFFTSFDYTIDEASKSILLTKGGRAISGISHTNTDPWAVPFDWEGKSMVVKVEINGKPLEMIFDTGAYAIALNEKAVHDLHIPVPAESPSGQTAGYGGTSVHTELDVGSIRLGPITQKDVHVIILPDRALTKPLLGLPFFSDYQYTVDSEHHLIHFLKR